MKKPFIPLLAGLLAMTLLIGCLELHLGGGATSNLQSPTLGQQLIDLQKAKDAGAISDQDYQAQKAKLLNSK
ncbi:MAG: SHOCT domain-containing protein [Verrucomicrobiota bacterium]|jgi:putative oligomerization/nucleic acid binding protein